MKLTEIARSSAVAWSPLQTNPGLLAAGTVAGTMTFEFDATGTLEIFSFSPCEINNEMKCLGKIKSSDRFHKLIWGLTGVSTETYKYGIIAGGLSNGTIVLWNPLLLVNGKEEGVLVATAESHTGPVQGLDFNPLQINLLASGGPNGEVFIWDLQNLSKPSVYSPGTKPPGLKADITCVVWNKKVPHILASAAYNGLTVIWDLRAKRPVLNFSDPNRKIKCRAVAWNPVEPTTIITASEDDEIPEIQLWDLQNTYTPSKLLQGHTKGVLSLSWCNFDPSLLLSCGKDNRTLCWDTRSGTLINEVEVSNNWNFDVQWSPCLPAVVSTCSLEGKIRVYGLHDFDTKPKQIQANDSDVFTNVSHQQQQQTTKQKITLPRPPLWLIRPCGATFAFGARLVRWTKRDSTRKPHIQIVRTEANPELIERIDKLEEAVKNKSFNVFCDEKIQNVKSEQEKSIWVFIKLVFEQNDHAKLLSHLGFDPEQMNKQIEDFVANLPTPKTLAEISEEHEKPKEETSATTQSDTELKPENVSGDSAKADEKAKDLSGLFANKPNGSASVFDRLIQNDKPSALQVFEPLPPLQFVTSSADAEGIISRALMVGNFQAAVEACLRTGRMADALVLAACGGADLWSYAREAYFRTNKDNPFMNLVSRIVKNDLKDLIRRADLRNWKEALVILCTYTKGQEFATLCDLLGDRLFHEKADYNAAALCYICAGNVDKIIQLWLQDEENKEKETKSSEVSLQDLIEKVVVLSHAIDQKEIGQTLASQFSRYAEFLCSQGRLDIALSYLKCMRESKFRRSYGAILLDRVFTCLRRETVAGEKKPEFPFDYVQIGSSLKGKEVKEKASVKTPKNEKKKTENQQTKKSDTLPSTTNAVPSPTVVQRTQVVASQPVVAQSAISASSAATLGIVSPMSPMKTTATTPTPLTPMRPLVTSPQPSVPVPLLPSAPTPTPSTPLLNPIPQPQMSAMYPSMTPSLSPSPLVGVVPPSPIPVSPLSRTTAVMSPVVTPTPLVPPPPTASTASSVGTPVASVIPTSTSVLSPPPHSATVPLSPFASQPIAGNLGNPPPLEPPPVHAHAPKAKSRTEKEEELHEVDESAVSAIIASLDSVLQKLNERADANVKPQLVDIQNRMKELYKKINSRTVTPKAVEALRKFATALNASDLSLANEVHEEMKVHHFHALGSAAMIGIKRLLNLSQSYRI
jgi:protein transport protein SEC31